MAGVGTDDEFRVSGQVELDVALQLERADEVPRSSADQHLGAIAGRRRGVDGLLDGGGIERRAIALRAIVAYVEDLLLGSQARAQRQCRDQRQRLPPGELFRSHRTRITYGVTERI